MLLKYRKAIRAIRDLELSGFLDHAQPSFDRSKWQKKALRGDPLQEECGRVFAVDAETLYEIGPLDYLNEMIDLLRNIGAPLGRFQLIEIPHRETRLRIGDAEYLLTSAEDRRQMNYWTPTFLRFVNVLNIQIRSSGASEGAYFTGTENDSLICLLTSPMVSALSALNQVVMMHNKLYWADGSLDESKIFPVFPSH